MNSRNLILIVLVLVVLAGGWFFLNNQNSQNSQTPTPTLAPETESTQDQSTSTSSSQTSAEVIVTITSAGFEPKEVTIKAGDSVVWKNTDSVVRNVSSAVHPTHQVYPPLNLGNIEAGGSKSLMFPDPGKYNYHDHLNPTLFGSVIVE